MSSSEWPADWYPDPWGRFDHRYWDGTAWTDAVARKGDRASDPPGGAVIPPPPQPEPEPAQLTPAVPGRARRRVRPVWLTVGLVMFFLGVVFLVAPVSARGHECGSVMAEKSVGGDSFASIDRSAACSSKISARRIQVFFLMSVGGVLTLGAFFSAKRE